MSSNDYSLIRKVSNGYFLQYGWAEDNGEPSITGRGELFATLEEAIRKASEDPGEYGLSFDLDTYAEHPVRP